VIKEKEEAVTMRETYRGSRRRRGDILLESIYQATVKILKEEGYANLTFQRIAQMTRTSRTVLYRRWGNPLALIYEIRGYRTNKALHGELIDKIENTGSLRGDLLLLLTLYQSVYVVVGQEIMNAVLFEMSQNNVNLVELSKNAIESNVLTMRKILRFAQSRGEKIRDVSPLTLTLPFDLIRVSNLLHQAVIDPDRLECMVDEILLPVFLADSSVSSHSSQ